MLERTLTASGENPRQVRRWAAGVLSRWELDAEVDRALLVLNELVTNALVHSPGGGVCRLSVDGGALEILVTDDGAGPPRRAVRAAALTPEPLEWERSGGRGLQIVAAVSDAWGLAFRDGRAGVWARWRLTPGWPYAADCVCVHAATGDGDEGAAEGADPVPLASGGGAVAMPGPWDLPDDDPGVPDGPAGPGAGVQVVREDWFGPSSREGADPGPANR